MKGKKIPGCKLVAKRKMRKWEDELKAEDKAEDEAEDEAKPEPEDKAEDEVKAEDIRGFIAKSGSEILRSVEIFDLYQGKHLEANEKSIAFKLIFQSDERTLKEKEVLDQFEKIITLVQNKYNARLRSR